MQGMWWYILGTFKPVLWVESGKGQSSRANYFKLKPVQYTENINKRRGRIKYSKGKKIIGKAYYVSYLI